MTDQEQKYRQRYVDLIVDDTSRARFVARPRPSPPSANSWSTTASWKSKRP